MWIILQQLTTDRVWNLNIWSNMRTSYIIIRAAAWQTNKTICALCEDSDQPGHPTSLISLSCALKDPRLLQTDSEDSDQNGQMPRPIRVLAGCIGHFVGFVMPWLNYIVDYAYIIHYNITTCITMWMMSLYLITNVPTNCSWATS